MDQYKSQFIEFMLSCGVLTFGDFTTKSGRKTPFFINTGKYQTGEQMMRLGQFYAEAIKNSIGLEFDVLFGPAYKGIPLAVTTSVALFDKYGKNSSICFNRKEAKDHGEGGSLIGRALQSGDKVLIIEDVTTAGTSVRESIPMLKSFAPVSVVGLVVSVDRMEKGTGTVSALQELREAFSISTTAIVTLEEIVSYLYNKPVHGKIHIDDTMLKSIEAYRKQYGA